MKPSRKVILAAVLNVSVQNRIQRGFHLPALRPNRAAQTMLNFHFTKKAMNSPMLTNDDLKWLAASSTELNAMLQQISRYSDLARQHKGQYNYITLLGERVETAAKSAQSIFDRVTSRILEVTTNKSTPTLSSPPSFTVVRSATETSAAILPIINELKAKFGAQPVKLVETGETSGSSSGQCEIKNSHGHRELILIIEDDVQVAEVAADMLADEGYKVIIAHDGFEAMRIYEKLGKEIGLVVLDFFLPVMDGDAVFEELRHANPNINVVLSSGFTEQSKLGQMLSQGLRGFIPKPYSRAKLLEQVRTILDTPKQVAR
jgi:CheY-like chemotaxis protein